MIHTKPILEISPTNLNFESKTPSTANINPKDRPPEIPIAMTTAELATSYAALILADDGVDITVSLVALIFISLIFSGRQTHNPYQGCWCRRR